MLDEIVEQPEPARQQHGFYVKLLDRRGACGVAQGQVPQAVQE
jgi:hypothetical protein